MAQVRAGVPVPRPAPRTRVRPGWPAQVRSVAAPDPLDQAPDRRITSRLQPPHKFVFLGLRQPVLAPIPQPLIAGRGGAGGVQRGAFSGVVAVHLNASPSTKADQRRRSSAASMVASPPTPRVASHTPLQCASRPLRGIARENMIQYRVEVMEPSTPAARPGEMARGWVGPERAGRPGRRSGRPQARPPGLAGRGPGFVAGPRDRELPEGLITVAGEMSCAASVLAASGRCHRAPQS